MEAWWLEKSGEDVYLYTDGCRARTKSNEELGAVVAVEPGKGSKLRVSQTDLIP